MAFWNRFFGGAGSTAAGVAIGATAVPALAPAAQAVVNEAWRLHPNRPPDVIVITQGVAQGQVPEPEARVWASENGFGDAQFDALVAVADTGPGVAYAFELWRRGKIGDTQFRRALKREALEQEWIDALVSLKRVLLSPSELANAVVQGHRTLDAATADAELQGLSAADFAVMVENTGLPPGPETGLAWLRRGILDEAEFGDVILEGHTKPKYIPKYLAALHPVLGAQTYAGLHLRGWISEAEMVAGGALTGYTQEQLDLLYKEHGRPATGRQVFIGLRRGGKYDGPTTGIDPAFVAAIRQSNIRPEWTNLLWAGRFTYPSAFVLRALTQAGDLTQAETEQILLYQGWEPTLAQTVSAKWAGGSGSAGSQQTKTELLAEYAGGYVTQDELRTTLAALGYTGAALDREVHLADARRNAAMRERVVKVIGDAYRMHAIDETAAASELAEVNVRGDAATMLIALWEKERRFTRREMTDRQVASAFKKGLLARDAALAELEERGFTAEDAARELAI